jgi:hypothetical protein
MLRVFVGLTAFVRTWSCARREALPGLVKFIGPGGFPVFEIEFCDGSCGSCGAFAGFETFNFGATLPV